MSVKTQKIFETSQQFSFPVRYKLIALKTLAYHLNENVWYFKTKITLM